MILTQSATNIFMNLSDIARCVNGSEFLRGSTTRHITEPYSHFFFCNKHPYRKSVAAVLGGVSGCRFRPGSPFRSHRVVGLERFKWILFWRTIAQYRLIHMDITYHQLELLLAPCHKNTNGSYFWFWKRHYNIFVIHVLLAQYSESFLVAPYACGLA